MPPFSHPNQRSIQLDIPKDGVGPTRRMTSGRTGAYAGAGNGTVFPGCVGGGYEWVSLMRVYPTLHLSREMQE